jgi:hypothetical protein
MGCLDALIAADKAAMEPRQDRYDDWYRRCQASQARRCGRTPVSSTASTRTPMAWCTR